MGFCFHDRTVIPQPVGQARASGTGREVLSQSLPNRAGFTPPPPPTYFPARPNAAPTPSRSAAEAPSFLTVHPAEQSGWRGASGSHRRAACSRLRIRPELRIAQIIEFPHPGGVRSLHGEELLPQRSSPWPPSSARQGCGSIWTKSDASTLSLTCRATRLPYGPKKPLQRRRNHLAASLRGKGERFRNPETVS